MDSNLLAREALMRREFSWTGKPITESYSQEIFSMHTLAREISEAEVTPFHIVEGFGNRPVIEWSALGHRILAVLRTDFSRIRSEYPKHDFSPVFIFWEHVAAQFSPNDPYFYRLKPAEKQKFVLQKLRVGQRVLRSDSFKSKNDNFRRAAFGNFQSLTTAINYLKQHRATAVVLRFDLYRPSLENDAINSLETECCESSQEFVDCHKRFHRSIDRWLKSTLCGYAWNISHRPRGGFRVRYLVFLDSKFGFSDGATLVDDLGERWRNEWRKKWKIKDEVKMKGGVYNGNAHPNLYQFPVLDDVRFEDGATMAGLQLIASYMTHSALFVKLKLEDNRDVFSKGRFPKKPVRTRGRPLQHLSEDWIEIAPEHARDLDKFNYF